MNDSFNNSLQTNTNPKKYPINTPPTNEWTIEQLLHWSLDQHHSAAISRTQVYIDTLRSQCDAECEDVMMLHDLALTSMREGDEQQQIGMMKNCDDQENVPAAATAAVENDDPQRVTNNTTTDTANIVKSKSTTKTQSNNNNRNHNNNNKTTLTIKVQSGPHTHQSFTLHPRPSHPCLIGRSKGKKFLRNGISLSKDQEVSTTHGKFTVERCCVDADMNVVDGVPTQQNCNKFYYTDVGSTNGSTVGDVRLEPNVRVEIVEGMEMRIGNSTLKILFG